MLVHITHMSRSLKGFRNTAKFSNHIVSSVGDSGEYVASAFEVAYQACRPIINVSLTYLGKILTFCKYAFL
jgi:hypothetical protein